LKLGKKRTRGKRVLDSRLLRVRLLDRTKTRTRTRTKDKEVDEAEGRIRGVDQVPELVDEVVEAEEEVVPRVDNRARARDNLKRHDRIV